MQLEFLGTGDAGGVPLYGCDCLACERALHDGRHRRRNCSALVTSAKDRILIDAGLPDLAERFPAGSLTAVVLTHFHADHVQGLFHLRWGKGPRITVYAPPDPEGCADLYKNPGLLDFRPLRAFEPFPIGELSFTPLPLAHSKLTYGYAIEDAAGRRFAYLTDTLGLPPDTLAFLAAWQPDGMAIDCSHPPCDSAPRNHNDYPRALECIAAVAPGAAWLTHLSHGFDAWQMQAGQQLPELVHIARDGDALTFSK